jgi:hypothetical protein
MRQLKLMATGLWFTEEDVRRELESLGFKDVSDRGLQSFSKELRELVLKEKRDIVERESDPSDASLMFDSATETKNVKDDVIYESVTTLDSLQPSPSPIPDHTAVRRPCSAVTKVRMFYVVYM